MNIQKSKDLGFILNPQSVAVYGVSRRSGFAWGRSIFDQLLRGGFQGKVYAINPKADEIAGHKAYHSISAIPEQVELAVLALPVDMVIQTIEECIDKGVKGVILITAGFSETEEGIDIEEKLKEVVQKSGIRIVGPNVSGIINLSSGFNASAAGAILKKTPISVICQGGFAISNMISSGFSKGMGVGKYLHTGNECDITCTDFLEYIGDDASTEVIMMYIEGLRDGRKFFETAKRISKKKPIVLAKLGVTEAGSRAASSHTGALAGSDIICEAAFRQANIIRVPRLEILLEVSNAFLQLPPLLNNRIAITTMGGTWGVATTDALAIKGLIVPEPSPDLQKRFKELGMPYWASTRNPIDLGAAGRSLDRNGQVQAIKLLISSDEFDGVIVHGFGSLGFRNDDAASGMLAPTKDEEDLLREIFDLIQKYNKPILVCNYFSEHESETIQNIVKDGKRVYQDVDDAATILSCMYKYYSRRKEIESFVQ
ncbi:MAG: CoA-binding protein [Thermodesulfobacteriota bacterium]|nr:CoA-binding protein [Thermodesulfobacteriota bacterium]